LDRYEKILSEILDKFAFQARNPEFNLVMKGQHFNTGKEKKYWEGQMKPILQNVEGIEGVYKIYLIILSLKQSWGQDKITRENIFTQQFNEIIKANPVELLPPEIKATVENVRDYIRKNGLKISNLIRDKNSRDEIIPFKGISEILYKTDRKKYKEEVIKSLIENGAKHILSSDDENFQTIKEQYPTQTKMQEYLRDNLYDFFTPQYIQNLIMKKYQPKVNKIKETKTLPDSTINKDMKEAEAKIIEKNRRDGEAEDTKREDIKRGRERQAKANDEYEENLIKDFYKAVDELTARISPDQTGKNHNLVISIDAINKLNVDELYELNDAIEYTFKLFRELRIRNPAKVFRTTDGKPYERHQDAMRVINVLRRKQGDIEKRIRELQEPEPEPEEAGQIEQKEGDGEDDTEELEGQGAIRINTKRRYKKRKSPKSKPKQKKTNKNKKVGGANLGALLL